MNAVLDYILHLLYPPKCMFCGKLLVDEDAEYCPGCIQNLPEYEGADRNIFGFDQTITTFFYKEPIRNAILSLKFRGIRNNSIVLGRWLAGTIRDKLKVPCDVVSWVPCSGLRKWKRGYDQAELLARAVSKELGLELCRVLRKKRHTSPQSRIKGEARRRANVLDAYEAYDPERWKGKCVLLVDDVLTTGSTMVECGKTLRLAGCGSLVCAAVAPSNAEKEKDE